MKQLRNGIGIGIWLVIAVIGAWGATQRLTQGHTLAGYGSYVTWGLWVSSYIYFIGLSAGAFLLSSLVYVFRMERLEKLGKLALFTALVTLIMALLSIWSDLGHMFRAWEVMLRPNFSSMMTWMVWLYNAYFLLLLAEIFFALRPDFLRWQSQTGWRRSVGRMLLPASYSEQSIEDDRKVLQVLGSIGVPLAVAFHGGVGALFATVLARPYWHSAIYPIMFLTGALVSGGALMTAIVAFFWPKRDRDFGSMLSLLGRIVLGLLLVDVLLEWAEFSVPMWYGIGHEFELLRRVLFGQYWYVFWIFHLVLGTLVPLALLILRPRSWLAVGGACALIAVTFMAVRLNLVIPGLITPELHGLETAFIDKRLTFEYLPSFFEWAVVCFILALGSAIFIVGRELLPLIPSEEEVQS